MYSSVCDMVMSRRSVCDMVMSRRFSILCLWLSLQLLSIVADSSKNNCSAGGAGAAALARAQALEPPVPVSVYEGEDEDHTWWEAHEDLLKAARGEWGAKNAALYTFNEAFEKAFMEPVLRAAVDLAYSVADDEEQLAAAEAKIRSLFSSTAAPNVYKFRLFNHNFCEALLEELGHFEQSRIPMRRPNGMNRFGAVLDDLGLDSMLQAVVAKYVRPLAQVLYPEHAVDDDFAEHHGFVVRYRRRDGMPGDVKLAEHADASTVTLNMLLSDGGGGSGQGNGVAEFSGGKLLFGGLRFSDTEKQMERHGVDFEGEAPGMALLHLGQQKHAAGELKWGERSNLIIWCFGKDGYVRTAAYDLAEQPHPARRWGGARGDDGSGSGHWGYL
jgi:hypothetical protein